MAYCNSFVVKIWTEDGQNLTRGHVQHVGTQESTHFTDLEKMADFMLNHLNWRVNGETGDQAKQPLANPRGGESSLWRQS